MKFFEAIFVSEFPEFLLKEKIGGHAFELALVVILGINADAKKNTTIPKNFFMVTDFCKALRL